MPQTQQQSPPDTESQMRQKPGHGETSYTGSDRLKGKAAVPHMKPGSAIANTASVNAHTPKPKLLAYSATKAAIVNFSAGLAQMLTGNP